VDRPTIAPARSSTDLRFAGMLVAIGVCFGTVLLPVGPIKIGSLVLDIGVLAMTGTPVGAVLAWWLTPWVARRSWRDAALGGALVGLAAAFLGVLDLAYLTLIAALAGSDPATGFGNDAFGALFIAVYGFGFGVVALPVTVPCGIVWALIARGLLSRVRGDDGPSPFGVRHLAILLLVIAIGAALVPVALARSSGGAAGP
jgi:hypothetical protein